MIPSKANARALPRLEINGELTPPEESVLNRRGHPPSQNLIADEAPNDFERKPRKRDGPRESPEMIGSLQDDSETPYEKRKSCRIIHLIVLSVW